MTEAFDEVRPPTDASMISARRAREVHKIPSATIRSWKARGLIYEVGLDDRGEPLYFEHQLVQLRSRRAMNLATRHADAVAGQTVATLPRCGEQAPVSLEPGASSCLEGSAVDELPVDLPRIRLLMCPELDPAAVEKFRAQVAELAAETTTRLANAVTSGLSVQGLTVHLNGPQDG